MQTIEFVHYSNFEIMVTLKCKQLMNLNYRFNWLH